MSDYVSRYTDTQRVNALAALLQRAVLAKSGVGAPASAVGRVAIDLAHYVGDGTPGTRSVLSATALGAGAIFYSCSDPTPMHGEEARDEFTPRWHQLPEDALRAVLDDVIRRENEMALRDAQRYVNQSAGETSIEPPTVIGAGG